MLFSSKIRFLLQKYTFVLKVILFENYIFVPKIKVFRPQTYTLFSKNYIALVRVKLTPPNYVSLKIIVSPNMDGSTVSFFLIKLSVFLAIRYVVSYYNTTILTK